MNKFKILILALVLIPGFLLAQTSLDSTVTNVSSDRTVYTTTTTDSSGSLDDDPTKNIYLPDDYTTTSDPVPTLYTEPQPTSEPTTSEPTTTTTTTTRPEDSTLNNIQTVTDNINDINEEQKILESELRDEIKSSIDTSILDIRSQTNIEAYELQRVVDYTRNNIYEDVNKTINNVSPTDSKSITDLGSRVENAVYDIERRLEAESGVDVDLSKNIVNIKETILRYEKIIEEKTILIQEREGDLLGKDTDQDGLSDYDEKFIYKTDPENSFTVPGELNDAEKIIAGINPIDPEQKLIEYQDPRDDKESVISKIHKLKKVELVSEDGVVGKRLRLEGTALPNSLVTVYIFSTPTIVTVKTDARGQWSYTLDKELDNGQHDVYVATVDNTGRLIARSESIPITQSAEAATLGTFGIGEPAPAPNDFIQENFILIVLAILLFAVIVVLILSGGKKDDDDDMFKMNSNSKDIDPANNIPGDAVINQTTKVDVDSVNSVDDVEEKLN